MRIAPELAAFLGRPPAQKAAQARPVHGYAGSVCETKPGPRPAPGQEEEMPRGVYQRKKKPDGEAVKPAKPAKEKKSPKAAASPKPRPRKLGEGAAKFGVFNDGTIELRLASCAGLIQPSEAREFVGFLKRIGVE